MNAKDTFNKNGFTILSGALSKEECNELVAYMFDLHKKGKLVRDEQCPLSDSIYGDPVFDNLRSEPRFIELRKKMNLL